MHPMLVVIPLHIFFGRAVHVLLSPFLVTLFYWSRYCVSLAPMCSCVAVLFELSFRSHTLFGIIELIICYRLNSMEEPRFTLFLVVEKAQRNTFESLGRVPISIVNPGRSYIGLREHRYDAAFRARYYATSGDVTPELHILLKIEFSAVGFMHFTTTSAGRAHNYAPLLFKKVYSKNDCDWKVWHLLQDLPMRWEASPGQLYVSTEWLDIEF